MNPFRAVCAALSFGIIAVSAQTTPGHFEFRDSGPRHFQLRPGKTTLKREQWLEASPTHAPDDVYWLGSRVALQLAQGTDVNQILKGSSLTLSETLDDNTFILQATDALTAATEADRLSKVDGVLVCTP